MIRTQQHEVNAGLAAAAAALLIAAVAPTAPAAPAPQHAPTIIAPGPATTPLPPTPIGNPCPGAGRFAACVPLGGPTQPGPGDIAVPAAAQRALAAELDRQRRWQNVA